MRIRVSCASQALIKIEDKYLLCLNKSSNKKGNKVYTPFGGALEYNPEALDFLNSLDVEFERQTPDLRLFMDQSNLNPFEIWFSQKKDREISIDRELIEEMVEEENIFEFLNENEFQSTYLRTIKNSQPVNDAMHYWYFEVYQVEFNREKINIIKNLLENADSHLVLASVEEIRKSEVNGIRIGGALPLFL